MMYYVCLYYYRRVLKLLEHKLRIKMNINSFKTVVLLVVYLIFL
jgi:hypothetical protein